MTTLWPVAMITFKEGIRNKSVIGIFLFSLFLLCTNFFMAGMALIDIGKIAVDIALSTVSLAGLLLVLFVGINLMSKDLDKRTIYMVLSRPISRSQYIVGRFMGMVLIIVFALLIVSILAVLSIILIKAGHGNENIRFSWSVVILALFFIMLSNILLSALSFLFSSFVSTSFITLLLTVISYIIGQSMQDIRSLIATSQTSGIEISQVSTKIVQVAFYLFPNLSLFDIKLQAAHGNPVPSSYLFWTTFYGVVYICLVITASALLFRKKEFP